MTELAPAVSVFENESPDTSDSEASEDSKPIGSIPKSTDVGRRVLYYSTADKKVKYGTLRFLGETEFELGTWCGVELNNASGKNNGTFKGIRYFNCEPNHGVFVPLSKVELDFGRRSRPNSTPNSRNASVERDVPSTKSTNQSSKGINTLSLQQQLVNRLATPVHKRNKTSQPAPNNRRQPLKAFATKGVQREDLKEKKLPPFKAGGMVKARSTENISKENSTAALPKMSSSKKSTSERDLRGIGKKGPQSAKKEVKTLKKGRVNSCSDLVAESTPSRQLPILYPKTSTPIGPRDQQAPDGCSSPDDDSGSNTSQNDDQTATPVTAETAFIKTPTSDVESVHPPETTVKKSDLNGLQYAHVQLIREELERPSYNHSTVVQNPDAPGKIFKNRTSGSATLTHPLVTAKHEPEETTDGLSYTKLLEPDAKLEGVTVDHVLAALRQLHKQFMKERAGSTELVESLRQENSVAIGELKSLEEKHQGELKQLRRVHEYKMKQLLNSRNK